MITFKFILLFDVLNLALIILKFIGYNLISAFSACLNSMIAISSVFVHFFFMSLINNNLVLFSVILPVSILFYTAAKPQDYIFQYL